MKTNRLIALLVLTLSTLNPQLSTLFAQGTAYTYQGRLNNGASPANGNYDLAFSLWNSSSGPAQVGATLTNAATAISNGLFTVTLDFGPGVFTGAARWLEISVRTNGGGALSTLTPRQPLASTPYAVQAANATTATTAASASSVSAANVSGVLSVGQLPSAVVTNGASGVTISGTFSGNGAGVTNVDVRTLHQFLGTVVAWGNDSFGQTTIPAGLSNVVAIAGGYSHSLALRSDGTVAAWGIQWYGQTTIPAGLSNVVAIAGGAYHSLALRSDGTVAAWGRNDDMARRHPRGLEQRGGHCRRRLSQSGAAE